MITYSPVELLNVRIPDLFALQHALQLGMA